MICGSVQFFPWRPWEVITGGLDSKLVMWDFSKGHPKKLVDFGVPDTDNVGSAGQCLNPAFVHAITIPEVDMVDRLGKVCVVARGDGVVDVIDIESELAVIKAFSMFGEKGKYIISGGNDKLVKAWDCSRYFDATQTSSNSDLLHLSISLSMKVKLALYHSSGLRQPYCLRHIKSGEGIWRTLRTMMPVGLSEMSEIDGESAMHCHF
ncbi:WD repeat-containing protein 53 [Camellia lanceoleosa]|uniref:WD repeat-containing protein 53 n=1 Tax=Camellia lanceoleosa TaxID=1840588 RepID=A0ACC0IDX7_9ERIC|nr:WD repeat-containing protein 53 [Camellia lanceoleosa]